MKKFSSFLMIGLLVAGISTGAEAKARKKSFTDKLATVTRGGTMGNKVVKYSVGSGLFYWLTSKAADKGLVSEGYPAGVTAALAVAGVSDIAGVESGKELGVDVACAATAFDLLSNHSDKLPYQGNIAAKAGYLFVGYKLTKLVAQYGYDFLSDAFANATPACQPVDNE